MAKIIYSQYSSAKTAKAFVLFCFAQLFLKKKNNLCYLLKRNSDKWGQEAWLLF